MARPCLPALLLALALSSPQSAIAEPQRNPLFGRENLVAWCIVPFDAKQRGPEDRAAMMARLGFTKFAYDYRAEHIPMWDAEMDALRRHNIELTAWWFPTELNDEARRILAVCKRHNVRPQLWVTGGGEPTRTPEEQQARIAAEAELIRPIAQAAAELNMKVGLYNHGGWFGEPENQIAVIEHLAMPNIGIVYNLHHGHDHLERFPELLAKMKPHLLCFNLNGMISGGEKTGQKIVPIAQGEHDLKLLQAIQSSGYSGLIGILGHTQDDAEERLLDNLAGLDWLVPQLDGSEPKSPRPTPRTYSQPTAQASQRSFVAEGRDEYRNPPITVEVRAKLDSKTGYNILVASDTKASGAHWEIFTNAGDGKLSVYFPGMQPDHLRSSIDVCDGKAHQIVFQYEARRARLFVDGKLAAEEAIKSLNKPAVPGGIAFGRLVEGGFGIDGTIDYVRIARGVRESIKPDSTSTIADKDTLGLWRFEGGNAEALDQSSFKNHARSAPVAVATRSAAPAVSDPPPPPGVHLKPVDPKLRAVLIHRDERASYMAVRADSEGRLFVGGREAVFIFEPQADGSYGPRKYLASFPQDSIIIGLELRGDDVYVLTTSALYLLPGVRVKHDRVEMKRLLWGLPLNMHLCFHCLAWGPEGDLYLTFGDPLHSYGDWGRPDHWGHWTFFAQPEGTKIAFTGTGGVLRLRPDGTNLQVVASGFRGPVGLAFDREWNLFTNDNDHESRADLYAPARLMHVTPQLDFAWPRGWLASKNPRRADLLDTMSDELGRGVPCDLAYYDDPYLGDELQRNLLMCRWDRMAVTRYPYKPRGASFTTEEHPFVVGQHNARPTGITVDRAGRVFVTCLYQAGNVVSPYSPSDLVMIMRADESPATAQRTNPVSASVDDLYVELKSDSWERRRQAHNELLRRGPEALRNAAERLAAAPPASPEFFHLVWLAAAERSDAAQQALRDLASHEDPSVRQQAVRALAEFYARDQADGLLTQALHDHDAGVQLSALGAYFMTTSPPPIKRIAELAESGDSYVRQTAALLLARRAKLSELQLLAMSEDASARLAGALALGMRLTLPTFEAVPPDELKLHFPAEDGFFRHTLHFVGQAKPVDLRDHGPVGNYTTAEWWKTIEPTDEQTALFDALALLGRDSDTHVRAQVAYYLGLLRDDRTEPLVARIQREPEVEALAGAKPQTIDRAWFVGPFADRNPNLQPSHPPETALIDLTAEFPAAGQHITWNDSAARNGRFQLESLEGSEASSYLLVRFNSLQKQSVLLSVDAARAKIWRNSRPVEAFDLPGLQQGQAKRGPQFLVDLEPGSNDLLVRVRADTADSGVQITYRAAEPVTVSLPEKLDASLLATRLKSGGVAGQVSPELVNFDWSKESASANSENGRRLFGSLGCVKCHAIQGDQKGGGAPSLVDARKRFTVPHLIQSIVLPSEQVAEPFRASTVLTTGGEVLSGLIISDTNKAVELLLADTTRRTITKEEIDERKPSEVSAMPSGVVKTAAELRDLIAYLLSDNPLPP